MGIYSIGIASNAQGLSADPKDTDRDKEQDKDETPETPLDEPRPPAVEDPPSEPGDKGPYVVRECASAAQWGGP